MTERLNNDQIAQLILDANSDLQRYLNLAPGVKLSPPEPRNTIISNPNIYPSLSLRPTLRP
ncbi:MAG TPA: hypothetical protein DD730_02160 [Desulfosporosinus sp.]|jgi:hypothetical protein|nr:hypothetical protein [Desulfosporosinus sp.]